MGKTTRQVYLWALGLALAAALLASLAPQAKAAAIHKVVFYVA